MGKYSLAFPLLGTHSIISITDINIYTTDSCLCLASLYLHLNSTVAAGTIVCVYHHLVPHRSAKLYYAPATGIFISVCAPVNILGKEAWAPALKNQETQLRQHWENNHVHMGPMG